MTLNNEQRRALYARKKETARKQREFWAAKGLMPAYDGEPNIPDETPEERNAQLEPWQKAPGHMQDNTHEDGGLNEAATKKQGSAGGRARGAQQSEAAAERQQTLKWMYPEFVGKRGAARVVCGRERKRLEGVESEDEKTPSLRAAQRIFAQRKKISASSKGTKT